MERNAQRDQGLSLAVLFLTDWYDIKAPSIFEVKTVGKTLVNRSQGLKNANDSLKGRVVELSLGDLNKDEDQSFRKIKLRVEDIKGKNCLTSFYGMSLTSDKLRSLVRKWQSLIEAHLDVRTADGYLVRLFAIAFTRKNRQQVKKTAYAQSAQIRQIRAKMMEIMKRESECELKDLVQKFVPESIGREIEKATKVSRQTLGIIRVLITPPSRVSSPCKTSTSEKPRS